MIIVLFGVAATLGTVVRWQVGGLLPPPLGTLLVNISGAFALGLMDHATADQVTILGIGGLGALTTFSTLSNEFRALLQTDTVKATLYLAVTVVAGIAAATAGLALAP